MNILYGLIGRLVIVEEIIRKLRAMSIGITQSESLTERVKPHSIQNLWNGGTWVAQWVKASAFSSGHDPRVLGSSPALGSLLRREPALSSLSSCLSAYL